MLPELIQMLTDAIAGEFGTAPWVCTLATVGLQGGGAARSVVCRRIDMLGQFYFVSDARSSKNAEICRQSMVELVLWLPRARRQFRVNGYADVLNNEGPVRIQRELWAGLSDATRATFHWPPPGERRVADDAAFPTSVRADAAFPENFEVIALHPRRLESLDLNPHPHDRRRWVAERQWQEERLNP